ncbi:MAG: hypothetical protein EOS25_26305, partial [Mesorhizobium sp.]
GQRPPLSCRTSPPQGGRLAFITDFANYRPCKKDAVREAADLPPKWGRCQVLAKRAGQRGARRIATERFYSVAPRSSADVTAWILGSAPSRFAPCSAPG